MTFAKYANTPQSRELDSMIKRARKELKQEFSGSFDCHKKLNHNDWVKYFNYKPIKTGCEPDGGLWYLNGALVAVFEGKHQGDGGNADERWGKNANLINHIFGYYNLGFGIYHTLATGLACRDKWRDSEVISSVTYGCDCRWTLKENGFTYEEILDIMRNTLNEILGKNNIPHVSHQPRGILPNV